MIKAFLAFIIVAFGQPAFSYFLSILASAFGYALFWHTLLDASAKKRFWMGTLWFSLVQAVHLSWLLSHPYGYIFGLYFFLCFAIGLQFGCICLLVTRKRIEKWSFIFGIAAVFTLFEWLRLFFLSGYSLNPIGLSLTGTLWGLQNASIAGVYGLTFYVLLTNLLMLKKKLVGVVVSLLPYLFGYVHLQMHQVENSPLLNVLLVQTAFPIEENLSFTSFSEAVDYVENEWKEILEAIRPFQNQKVDLIVLPEYVVPYGTYMAIFPFEEIKNLFQSNLPPLKEPLAIEVDNQWIVTNGYLCQAIADLFQADLVAGLQDEDYSSALYFWPGGDRAFRYEKRVLLPMAEYIPFDFCKKLAAKYGITGSFEAGQEAKVFPGTKVPFGLSICYEETFGNLMRESRLNGGELLVNLTSDVWYPNSKLPKVHFDHARLRTTEAGIPLVRACNTGLTCAISSLGETLATTKEEEEWKRQALFVQVPLHSYSTLYASFGDLPIIALSGLLALIAGIKMAVRRKSAS